jgi:hypothetical protein
MFRERGQAQIVPRTVSTETYLVWSISAPGRSRSPIKVLGRSGLHVEDHPTVQWADA